MVLRRFLGWQAQASAILENAMKTANDLMTRAPGRVKSPAAAEEACIPNTPNLDPNPNSAGKAWKDTAVVIEAALR